MPQELADDFTLERALITDGFSEDHIHQMVALALERAGVSGGTVVDVACGSGALWKHLSHRHSDYIGVDLVKYPGFTDQGRFVQAELGRGPVPLPDDIGSVVLSVETIEHLENPRAFMRELVRLAKPGAWVGISTPNVLSLRSLISLLTKQQFMGFRDGDYPAHITPILEVDLRRMASEVGLENVEVVYSRDARVPLTRRAYPRVVARVFPRACSDIIFLLGRRSAES